MEIYHKSAEFPIKTNYEIVKVFKIYNGAIDISGFFFLMNVFIALKVGRFQIGTNLDMLINVRVSE